MKTEKVENNLDDLINQIATLQYELKGLEDKNSDPKNRKEYKNKIIIIIIKLNITNKKC